MKTKEELLKKRDDILMKMNGLTEEQSKPLWDEYYKTELEFAKLNPDWIEKICSRCGEIIGSPALSRTDNKTEVCGKCGLEESINEFYKGQALGGTYYRGKWIEWS